MRFLLHWLDFLWFEFGYAVSRAWRWRQEFWLEHGPAIRDLGMAIALIPALFVLFPIVLLCGFIGFFIEGPQSGPDRRLASECAIPGQPPAE